MRLKDMRIGNRLVGGYGVFILIILLLCGISIKNMRITNQQTDDITQMSFQKVLLAHSVIDSIQVITRETAKAVYRQDVSTIGNIVAERRKIYREALDKLEKMEDGDEGKKIINRLKESIAKGREGNIRLGKAIESGEFNEARTFFMSAVEPATKENLEIITELVRYQEKGVDAKHLEILKTNRSVMLILIGFGAAALVLSIFVSIALTRSITSPIQKNIEVAKSPSER